MQGSKVIQRDQELLSAYLDNRLEPAERARLEARLAAEPVLSAELDDLRRTVAAVRALPAVRAPRNFTLNPKTAPRRAANWMLRLYPVMQYATVAAAFVFVVLLFGRAAEFLPLAGGAAAPMPASLPMTDAQMTQVVENAGGAEQATVDPSQRSSVPAATPLPQGTAAPVPELPAVPTGTVPAASDQTATAAPPPDASTFAVTETPPAVDPTMPGTPEMKTTGETVPAEESDADLSQQRAGPDFGALANLAGLAVLALAGLTLLLRRSIGRA